MDYIYWVVSRACNQSCPHCYNNSGPDAPGLTIEEVDRCVENFPDPDRCDLHHVMLSGGEVLAWPELFYHTLRRVREKYGEACELMIQTNGDLLDEYHLDKMLGHGVTRIDIASQDKFHLPATLRRADYLHELFASHGVAKVIEGGLKNRPPRNRPPVYNMWGANPGTWIGPLWPRGRAYLNNLSTASPDDNFCGNWSGAINFLNYDAPQGAGCELSLQLSEVYPCCPMTCRPIGNLLRENLTEILDRCRQHPVYQALNEGRPEKMGEFMGLSQQHGIERTKSLGNHCLWCDEFFTKHAPHLLEANGRTSRNAVELTINGRRASGVKERDIRREFANV